MTRRARHKRQGRNQKAGPAPQPKAAADEVPDVTARRSLWKYVVIAAVFIAWTALLLYCGLAGGE